MTKPQNRRIKNTIAIIATSLSVLIQCSCRNMAPERDNVLAGYVPEKISSATDEVAVIQPDRWWESFGSAQLSQLMDKAFSDSLTIEQAAARVQQFEAIARKSGSTVWPKLDARGEASTRKSGAEGSIWTDSYSGGLYASYEVDFWGEVNMTKRAALADLQARKYDLQTAAMTLSGNLASTYFTWLARMEILSVYESQLVSNRKKLESLKLRYRTGSSTSLAVLQQRQQVAAAEARMPPVHAEIQTLENRIAVLTGAIPGSDLGLAVESLPALPLRPTPGLPLRVLANRPDVQSARLALFAADLDIGVARAARLPSITLSGSATSDSGELSDLFDEWAKRLAANLVGPLLDGGLRKAELDRTIAVSREKIADYRQTVLEAVQEVEDSLINERYQIEFLTALEKQYIAAQNNEEESIRRYRRGIVTYLDTLNATTARESLEISLVQANLNLLQDRIQLYRALGGDWRFLLEE